MNTIGYAEYLNEFVRMATFGKPLFTEDIAVGFARQFGVDTNRAKKTVNVYLKRFADSGVLTRIRRGVYGKNKTSAFGLIVPDSTQIMYSFFTRDGENEIGYLAGPALLNILGLSTLIPAKQTIVTNRYRYRINPNAAIETKRPVIKVTNKNNRYLQAIEAVKAMRTFPIDADEPVAILRKAFQNMEIDVAVLMRYANEYCKEEELREIIKIAFGEAETE
jgi:hypothetical protein